jgi:hypothetical protein
MVPNVASKILSRSHIVSRTHKKDPGEWSARSCFEWLDDHFSWTRYTTGREQMGNQRAGAATTPRAKVRRRPDRQVTILMLWTKGFGVS